jgi:hypothetical protein
LRKRIRRTATLIGSTVAAGLFLAGCTTAPAAGGPAITDFEYVHGLGHDLRSGAVFAATHNGVWELPTSALPSSFGTGSLISPPDNVPLLVADRRQDTMGFLATDTGLLLGSGHPDPTDPSLPSNLGFITSGDGAQTWTAVSLAGETDFHDIDAVTLPTGAQRVYGYDATQGTVLISDDSGATWAPGAALELRDLVADPVNPDQVYATTAAGLQISQDAARTFTPTTGTPALYLIDSSGTGYVGIDTAGAIWHAADTGAWVQGGAIVGDAQALSFAGGTEPWMLVADDRGVLATRDFGTSWTSLVESGSGD